MREHQMYQGHNLNDSVAAHGECDRPLSLGLCAFLAACAAVFLAHAGRYLPHAGERFVDDLPPRAADPILTVHAAHALLKGESPYQAREVFVRDPCAASRGEDERSFSVARWLAAFAAAAVTKVLRRRARARFQQPASARPMRLTWPTSNTNVWTSTEPRSSGSPSPMSSQPSGPEVAPTVEHRTGRG